jgi:hypothetical protein
MILLMTWLAVPSAMAAPLPEALDISPKRIERLTSACSVGDIAACRTLADASRRAEMVSMYHASFNESALVPYRGRQAEAYLSAACDAGDRDACHEVWRHVEGCEQGRMDCCMEVAPDTVRELMSCNEGDAKICPVVTHITPLDLSVAAYVDGDWVGKTRGGAALVSISSDGVVEQPLFGASISTLVGLDQGGFVAMPYWGPLNPGAAPSWSGDPPTRIFALGNSTGTEIISIQPDEGSLCEGITLRSGHALMTASDDPRNCLGERTFALVDLQSRTVRPVLGIEPGIFTSLHGAGTWFVLKRGEVVEQYQIDLDSGQATQHRTRAIPGRRRVFTSDSGLLFLEGKDDYSVWGARDSEPTTVMGHKPIRDTFGEHWLTGSLRHYQGSQQIFETPDAELLNGLTTLAVFGRDTDEILVSGTKGTYLIDFTGTSRIGPSSLGMTSEPLVVPTPPAVLDVETLDKDRRLQARVLHNGRPIAGAQVTFTPSKPNVRFPPLHAMSDAEGMVHFQVSLDYWGGAVLARSGRLAGKARAHPARLEDQGALQPIELAGPLPEVRGTVLNSAGEPVADAEVSGNYLATASVYTGPDGTFSHLLTSGQGRQSLTVQSDVGMAVVTFDRTESVMPVDVEVNPTKRRSYRVVDVLGEPLSAVKMTVHSRRVGQTDEDGNWSTWLPENGPVKPFFTYVLPRNLDRVMDGDVEVWTKPPEVVLETDDRHEMFLLTKEVGVRNSVTWDLPLGESSLFRWPEGEPAEMAQMRIDSPHQEVRPSWIRVPQTCSTMVDERGLPLAGQTFLVVHPRAIRHVKTGVDGEFCLPNIPGPMHVTLYRTVGPHGWEWTGESTELPARVQFRSYASWAQSVTGDPLGVELSEVDGGVQIVSVEPDSIWSGSIEPGTTVTAVNQAPVATAQELLDRIHEARADWPFASIQLEVQGSYRAEKVRAPAGPPCRSAIGTLEARTGEQLFNACPVNRPTKRVGRLRPRADLLKVVRGSWRPVMPLSEMAKEARLLADSLAPKTTEVEAWEWFRAGTDDPAVQAEAAALALGMPLLSGAYPGLPTRLVIQSENSTLEAVAGGVHVLHETYGEFTVFPLDARTLILQRRAGGHFEDVQILERVRPAPKKPRRTSDHPSFDDDFEVRKPGFTRISTYTAVAPSFAKASIRGTTSDRWASVALSSSKPTRQSKSQ